MDIMIQTLLKDIKYEKNFPPINRIAEIKNNAAEKGTLNSGPMRASCAKAYYDSVQEVMYDFLDKLLRNTEKLDLTSEEKMRSVINEGFEKLRSDVAISIPKDVGLGEVVHRTIYEWFERDCNSILEAVQRKISLNDLDLGQAPSVQVITDQIGNVFVGNINQSSLNLSVQNIMKQGGEEAKAGKILNNFIQKVNELNKQHEKEKNVLLDLTRGLIQMIQQPELERSKSSMVAILDKIKIVADVSHEIHQFVQDNWPVIIAGLKLLNITQG